MMPGTSGMDLLRAAKTVAPETEVVLMTAYGTVETAVDAMKEGAYDFAAHPPTEPRESRTRAGSNAWNTSPVVASK